MRTKQNRYRLILIVIMAALLLMVFPPAGGAKAQGGSAADLLAAVNAYRAANGLEPYSVDGGLMSLAQGHAEYQASIETCTHLRADGSDPSAYGISAENIACGPGLSVQDAIYYQWSDGVHLATLLGPTSGLAGAGVAESNGTVYYTLAVKRLSGSFDVVPQTNPQNDAPAEQNVQGDVLLQDLSGPATSTPNSDGSISHIIQYGETLITIAELYGVPVDELVGLNRLDPSNPSIFAGQALLVRLAFTETPFITSTYTPRPPTRTPLPSRTPRPTRTITPVQSPVPTGTPTSPPLIKVPTLEEIGSARTGLTYTVFAVAALAFIGFLLTLLLPGQKK